jgi:hypothetical protein
MWTGKALDGMSKNRVEQLESTVAELESTVEGLTGELIEAKERIRVLEAELDTDTPTRVPKRRSGEDEPDDAADARDLVADEGDETPSDADADATAGDEAEDSGTDDIIVA